MKKIKTNDPRTISLGFMVDTTYQVEYASVKVNPLAEEVVEPMAKSAVDRGKSYDTTPENNARRKARVCLKSAR